MPNEEAEKIKVPIQLPHRVLHYLTSECKLDINDNLVRNYWQHLETMGDDVALQTKEFRQLAGGDGGSLCWPLGFHGDEANIGIVNNPTNKVIGMTLNLPLFRPHQTRLSRYLLFVIESERVWSVPDTIYPVLDAITHSFNYAAEHGVAGRRVILTEIRGDQSWLRFIFRHDAYWIGNNVCFRCKASAKPTSLNYCLNGAPGGWESTVRSTAEFINDELYEPHCSFYFFICDVRTFSCLLGSKWFQQLVQPKAKV